MGNERIIHYTSGGRGARLIEHIWKRFQMRSRHVDRTPGAGCWLVHESRFE
jgi:hypothetical protein